MCMVTGVTGMRERERGGQGLMGTGQTRIWGGWEGAWGSSRGRAGSSARLCSPCSTLPHSVNRRCTSMHSSPAAACALHTPPNRPLRSLAFRSLFPSSLASSRLISPNSNPTPYPQHPIPTLHPQQEVCAPSADEVLDDGEEVEAVEVVVVDLHDPVQHVHRPAPTQGARERERK
eukprot:262283-Rhodomonas_salina.1